MARILLNKARMPSHTHEALAELLCDSPQLIEEVMGRLLHVPLPPYASAVRVDAKLTDLVISEHRSDGVVVFRDAAGQNVAVVVVEIQLRPDSNKEWVWPAYVTLTRARHRCPTDLLVVTIDESTAEWARTEIAIGRAHAFRPLVVGPGVVPRVERPEDAANNPELAVLSALAHSRAAADAPLIRAVLDGLSAAPLENTRFAYYRDVIEQRLSPVLWRALEALMPYPGWEPVSEVSKAIFRGIAEGKELGRAEGQRGMARMLVAVLTGRGFRLSDEQKAMVEQATEAQMLAWSERAGTVNDLSELFADTPNAEH